MPRNSYHRKGDFCWVECTEWSTTVVHRQSREYMRLCDEHNVAYEDGEPAPTASGEWPWTNPQGEW